AELLGVQAEGGLLRRVPADGYGSFDRLCNKLVPKTAFVLEVVIGHSAASSRSCLVKIMHPGEDGRQAGGGSDFGHEGTREVGWPPPDGSPPSAMAQSHTGIRAFRRLWNLYPAPRRNP